MKNSEQVPRWKRYTTRGILAAAVAGAGIGGAAAVAGASSTTHASSSTTQTSAAGPGMPPPGGMGRPGGPELTVTSVTPSTLVATSLDGTSHTFDLTASTTYTKDGASDTESDLAVGEHVAVMTTSSSSGSGTSGSGSSSSTTATATSVNIISPSVTGTVVSTSGSGSTMTIVVSDESGFYRTITTSASTSYTDDGTSVTSPTIAVGTFIAARGTVAADHTTLDATSIAIGVPTPPSGGGSGGPGNGPAGGQPPTGSSSTNS